MKYKVVKDEEDSLACYDCCFLGDKEGCSVIGNKHNLISCIDNDCHFELADEITDVDLREIDEAHGHQ